MFESHSKIGQLENSICRKGLEKQKKIEKKYTFYFQIFFAKIFLRFMFLIPKIALKNFKNYIFLSKTKFSCHKLSLNKLL